MSKLKIIGSRHKKIRKIIIGLLLTLFLACSAALIIFYGDVLTAGTTEEVYAKSEEETGGMTDAADVSEDSVSEDIKDDLRDVRFDRIEISSFINDGDYIDIRLQYPDGDDCIVVSKKQLIEADRFGNCAVICVDEEELLTLNNAHVEESLTEGARLYAVKYVDPDSQPPAEVSYHSRLSENMNGYDGEGIFNESDEIPQ